LVGYHSVYTTMYFAIFRKFCNGCLMMVFAERNMYSCWSKNKRRCKLHGYTVHQ